MKKKYIDAGNVQALYYRNVGIDIMVANLALQALEHGIGCDAWEQCEKIISDRRK